MLDTGARTPKILFRARRISRREDQVSLSRLLVPLVKASSLVPSGFVRYGCIRLLYRH